MVFQVRRPVQSDPDVLAAYRHDASPLVGDPQAVARPEDPGEAADLLAEAASQGIPVTPCGGRTSTTGGGLARSGWALSCERLAGVEDIDPVRLVAVVRAGTILGDFKDAARDQGLLYPPDPTSEKECSLGGTVACDASGARSFRYGATRRWVRGVEVACADGSLRWFRRRLCAKDAAGYAGLRDLVDLVCGSEGTLGFVTRVEVALVPLPEAFLAAMAFFSDVPSALGFVGRARGGDGGVVPRCLELLDSVCLGIMRDQRSGLAVPAGAGAAIFFEEEHAAGAEPAVLDRWSELLDRSPGAMPADTLVASGRAQQERLRALRHAVPVTLNELGRTQAEAGGMRLSTDWAVPFAALAGLMERADGWMAEARIGHVARFGHVGDGHPHYSLIARDGDEAIRAHGVADRMCREACALGGTVTAEHGIGKLKRSFAAACIDPIQWEAMRAVKRVFDPAGILAPGNLFPDL